MNIINDIEGFKKECKDAYSGKCIYVNINTFLELEKAGLIENSPENRRADESKWNNDNLRNYFERIEDESKNYELNGHKIDYFGLLEPITIVCKDGKFYTNDGTHRIDVLKKLNTFDFHKNSLKDLPESSFFWTVVQDCLKGSFSEKTIEIFSNCYMPIRFTNKNKVHYVGANSSKTMKGQQIIRACFVGNKYFDYMQECLKDVSKPFNLTAVGNSSEETSTADTISCMALAGGDCKATKVKTPGYFLDKYSDEESFKKFIPLYHRFLDIFSSKLDVFDFVFFKGKFKSLYMYGLILAARDLAIEAYCDSVRTTYEFRMKEIKNDKEAFFFTLKGTLDVLESNKFDKIVEKSKIRIENLKVDSNATGNFSKGAIIRDEIMKSVKADKNGKKIYPIKYKMK